MPNSQEHSRATDRKDGLGNGEQDRHSRDSVNDDAKSKERYERLKAAYPGKRDEYGQTSHSKSTWRVGWHAFRKLSAAEQEMVISQAAAALPEGRNHAVGPREFIEKGRWDMAKAKASEEAASQQRRAALLAKLRAENEAKRAALMDRLANEPGYRDKLIEWIAGLPREYDTGQLQWDASLVHKFGSSPHAEITDEIAQARPCVIPADILKAADDLRRERDLQRRAETDRFMREASLAALPWIEENRERAIDMIARYFEEAATLDRPLWVAFLPNGKPGPGARPTKPGPTIDKFLGPIAPGESGCAIPCDVIEAARDLCRRLADEPGFRQEYETCRQSAFVDAIAAGVAARTHAQMEGRA